MSDLKSMYKNNVNIMEFFRKNSDDKNSNSIDAILTSYDLQSGSYTDSYEADKITDNFHINGQRVSISTQKIKEKLGEFIAGLIDNYDYTSVLEAGVGEATTLVPVVTKLKNQNAKLFARLSDVLAAIGVILRGTVEGGGSRVRRPESYPCAECNIIATEICAATRHIASKSGKISRVNQVIIER